MAPGLVLPNGVGSVESWGSLGKRVSSAPRVVTTRMATLTAPSQEYRRGDLLISTDRSRLDVDVIHAFLTGCYWAKDIPKDTVIRSIENSLCFGLYCDGV